MKNTERSKRTGMQRRWMKSTVLVIGIVLFVIVSLFAFFIHNYYTVTTLNGLKTKAQTATDFFANYISRTYAEYYDSAYRYTETFSDNDKIELQFVDTNGRVMMSTNGIVAGISPKTADVERALETGKISDWTGVSGTGENIMAVSAPVFYSGDKVIGVMRYITSLRLVERQTWLMTGIALAIAAVIMLFVIVLNLTFSRSVLEPMGEITGVAKRIAEGSYGVQISGDYKDETGEMVKAINEMSLKIARSEKTQSEFISSVSHELRTPLTAISGWAETLSYNKSMDEEMSRGISIISKEANRLTKMVEELLEFTRMQDGRFTLNIEKIDIVAELEDAVFTYRELLKQDDMQFEYSPFLDEMPMIPGDPARLRQVFLNLFDNAAKYAHDGKRINVSIKLDSEYVIISIRDYGSGIPEDEIENVKKKFYKGSNAKNRGSGIGLAVCDEIIRYHGGKFILENAEGGGLRASIYLPRE